MIRAPSLPLWPSPLWPELVARTKPRIRAQFDVISIKLNTSGTMGGGGREPPDGTRIFTNRTIASIAAGAAREPVFEVVGPLD